MGEAGADTNLTEIHEEISELIDTQVNVQNESLFQGSCKLLQPHAKCAMKMNEKRRKK